MMTCMTVAHLPNQLNFSPITLLLLPSLLLILTLPLSVYRWSLINGTLFEEMEKWKKDGMFIIWDVTPQIHSLFSEIHMVHSHARKRTYTIIT